MRQRRICPNSLSRPARASPSSSPKPASQWSRSCLSSSPHASACSREPLLCPMISTTWWLRKLKRCSPETMTDAWRFSYPNALSRYPSCGRKYSIWLSPYSASTMPSDRNQQVPTDGRKSKGGRHDEKSQMLSARIQSTKREETQSKPIQRITY